MMVQILPMLQKGSGLLSILPEPKNMSFKPSRSMMPHVLTRRPTPKPAVHKKPVAKPDPDSEDSGEEAEGADFFSLTSHVAPEPAEINLEDLLPPTAGPSKPPPSRVAPRPVQPQQVMTIEPEEPEESELPLDEEAVSQIFYLLAIN